MNMRDELQRINDEAIPHFYHSTRGAEFLFTTDKATRTSTCRVCQQIIPKGMRRAVFVLPTRPAQKTPSGGIISSQKIFTHIDCIKLLLAGNKREASAAALCADCQKKRANRMKPVGVGLRQWWGYLCDDCAALPRYGECGVCGVYYQSPRLSPAVDPPSGKRLIKQIGGIGYEVLVCDFCVGRGIIRVKEQLKIDRVEKQFETQYALLLMRFEKEGFFGKPKTSVAAKTKPTAKTTVKRAPAKRKAASKSSRSKAGGKQP